MGISRETQGAGYLAGPAIVVLGGRVRVGHGGDLRGALGRRVATAARMALESDAIVVASGGCVWSGLVEADAMAAALERAGVPAARIVRERCSLSTRDNARYAARVLTRRGIGDATIVTSAWHLPRALALFRREGVRVEGRAAEGEPHVRWTRRLWRWGRERIAMRLDGLA
jgi:uncharacterized SAM-binding protein YcdF (DUF218 family)